MALWQDLVDSANKLNHQTQLMLQTFIYSIPLVYSNLKYSSVFAEISRTVYRNIHPKANYATSSYMWRVQRICNISNVFTVGIYNHNIMSLILFT